MAAEAPRILVEVAGVEGSAPREAGTWMLVGAETLDGTIGGGRLEASAIDAARAMLREGGGRRTLRFALGPELGQCCGGRVRLRLAVAEPSEIAARRRTEAEARPVAMIYGAGHVGRALATALAPLPVRPILVDQREAELALAPAVETRLAALPEAEVRDAPAGAAHVVTTHDHGLDFLIAAEALSRGDAAYVGMIGSATKRAAFSSWARRRGVDPSRLVCPLAADAPADKRPAVIAAFAATEILRALAPRTSAPRPALAAG